MARTLRAGAQSGMTLLELLMVMGLLAVLMGIGLGSLASLNLGKRSAVGSVQNALRSARNSAVARGAGARVRLDPTAGKLSGATFEVVGTWHFEGGENVRGAFELDGSNHGAVYSEDGFIGKCATFLPNGHGWIEMPVQLLSDASFDLHEGFRIECALRVAASGGGRVLRLGDTIGIDVTARMPPRAWFVPEAHDDTGRSVKGGRIAVEADDGTLPPMVWKRVAFEYDRRRVTLYVDGVEIADEVVGKVAAAAAPRAAAKAADANAAAKPAPAPTTARFEESAPVWSIDSPLMLGDAQASFVGSLDNLVIGAFAVGDPVVLPEGVRFDPGIPAEVRFDAGGNLDREVHRDPVSLGLIFDDGRTATVRVGMYGTIE